MLPAERRLPHLTYMRSADAVDLYSGDMVVLPPPVWSAADLSRLVSCCPNLSVVVNVSLQHGRHVSELGQLQDLSTLHV